MRIESNCETGEIKYFDDADNEIEAPQLAPEPEPEPLPAEQPSAAEQPAED